MWTGAHERASDVIDLLSPHDGTDHDLRESESLFHAVWERAADAMALSNADGIVARYPFILEGAKRTAMLSVIRDVTEREELDAAQRNLLRYKDDFLLAASHDLKSPLTSIKGRAQLLKRRLASGRELDAALLLDELTEIERSASRMSGLINSLLDTASIEIGQQLILQRRSADLLALARRVAAQEQRTSDEHQIVVASDESSVVGSWDVDRLERILENLLSNSITYSPDGGEITVSVRLEEESGGTWAILSVTDDGLGIPANDIPHVFDRFHRGANVTDYISGTGIGLASTRQIVEQHGGTIAIRSAEGSGTVVTIRLPLEESTPESR
jgi:signal transduction histidine kinase